MVPESEARSSDLPAAPQQREAPLSVLVVDDDPKTRNVVRKMLELDGQRVREAADGESAWQLFLEERPEIVVCDVQMPGLSGLQLAERIREASELTEVVMITGFADTEVVIEALRKGASNFVEKPFTVNEFRDQMGRSIARCRLAREAASLQEQLNQERRRQELNARMATMGRLVAGLAHEIQNPVTFIKGNTELVRLLIARLLQDLGVEKGGASATAAEEIETLLQDMEYGTRRIGELVEAMRRFAAPGDTERGPVLLTQLLERSRKLAEHRRPDGVQLSVELADGGVYVQASAVEMESCFVNLLVNAYEAFADGGGQVCVRTTVLPFATGTFDGLVEVTVEDDGPGIPKGILDEVYTPFFTRKSGGTGLGLSIAFEAAKRNGAQMQIDSEEGAGTRITLRMPYAAASGDGASGTD